MLTVSGNYAQRVSGCDIDHEREFEVYQYRMTLDCRRMDQHLAEETGKHLRSLISRNEELQKEIRTLKKVV